MSLHQSTSLSEPDHTLATTDKPVADEGKLKKRFDRLLSQSGTYSERVHLIDRSGKALNGPIFYDNYDHFADEMAHGMRHLIKFRSDDGKYARGQVRGDRTLQRMHRAYRIAAKNGSYPVHGQQCGLEIYFVRRRLGDPKDRWLMSIIYRLRDVEFIDIEQPDLVEPGEKSPDLIEARCRNFRQGLSVALSNLHKISSPVKRNDTANLIYYLQGQPSCVLAKARGWHFNDTLWRKFTAHFDQVGPDSRDALVAGKGWPMDGAVDGKEWRTEFVRPWFTSWGAFDGNWDSEAASAKVISDTQHAAFVMRSHVDRHRHAQAWLSLVEKFDNLPFTDVSGAIGKNLKPVLKLFDKMRKGDMYAYSAFDP